MIRKTMPLAALGLVLLLTCRLSGEPKGEGAGLTPVSEINKVPNTPDPDWKGSGNKNSDMYWICEVKVCGPYVITIGRNGWICTFDFDRGKGSLAYKCSSSAPLHNWEWYYLAPHQLANKDWIVYCAYNNVLCWFKLNVETGKLDLEGQMNVVKKGFPFLLPDKKRILLAGPAGAQCLSLDEATGKPTVLSTSKAAGREGCISPDGKNYYATTDDHFYSYGIDATTGALTEMPAMEIKNGDSNKWGVPCISPDGKNVYKLLAAEVAVLERDGGTGVLTFKNAQKIDDIGCIMSMTFSPDGRNGYFSCMGEGCKGASSSNCVGWLTRDPSTGALTYGGRGGQRGGFTRVELDDADSTLFSLIKLGPSTICSFRTDRSAQTAPATGVESPAR